MKTFWKEEMIRKFVSISKRGPLRRANAFELLLKMGEKGG
jgi:hypothetical protein